MCRELVVDREMKYRYLDKKYIDELLSKGEYLISPLSTYREIEDMRQDGSELSFSIQYESNKDFETEQQNLIKEIGIPAKKLLLKNLEK